MLTQGIIQKYQDRLSSIPAPGGNGCHPSLLGTANLGVMAGLTPEQIFVDLRQSIPPGTRRVSSREIINAIDRAVFDHRGSTTLLNGEKYHRNAQLKVNPLLNDGKIVLQNIIKQAVIWDEADIWDASPVRIDWLPEEDAVNFLSLIYNPPDMIFIGERVEPGIIGQNIRSAAEWIEFFKKGGKAGPFIIMNPLTGKPAPKKSGDGITFRGDRNIAFLHYCLVEFDNLTSEEQLRFLTAAKLPIRALIDTGGKSIHAWLDIRNLADITTHDHWDANIKSRLYDQLLKPMGVDQACSNPARLSRLPGHLRSESNKYQRLLWLSLEGRRISI